MRTRLDHACAIGGEIGTRSGGSVRLQAEMAAQLQGPAARSGAGRFSLEKQRVRL
ncbi:MULTISPECIES: hypothetical protein [unclassified Paenibacillus]|uniref:hypothetical protein n=1 Tax=unclassified Paenibacillus TaxID=185978 RepID=UPI0012FDFDEC|nr:MULTISPECIES: hypothetical protein [unclassified Paenibacillus]QID16075.1 hypothetical protein CIC07_25445 [Paenibacillus sp. RUD330]